MITISHTFPLSFQQSVEKRAGLLLLLWSFSQINPHRRAKFDKVQNDKGGVDGCHDRVVISEIVLRINANGQQLVRVGKDNVLHVEVAVDIAEQFPAVFGGKNDGGGIVGLTALIIVIKIAVIFFFHISARGRARTRPVPSG